VVSLVIITLYVPCIANFFVMIKERGLRTALAIVGVILVIATAVGGGLNQLLLLLGANP
jgi:ferrous iron transport protein B